MNYEISANGKTVTVNGKTYSMSSFKNQFEGPRASNRADTHAFDAGAKGTIGAKANAPEIKQVKVDDSKLTSKTNQKTLKEVSKPVASESADKARAAAEQRARMTPPSNRTKAQSMAMSRDNTKPKGSQANHHVTDSKNHSKTVKGGSLGGGALGIGEFIEQIK